MLKRFVLSIFGGVGCIFVSCVATATPTAFPDCQRMLMAPDVLAQFFKPPTVVEFDFPGVQVASLSDPSFSTGSTLFYFPSGARTVADARGGSVSASETTLLEDGSYSNVVDGLFFSGGSTMGLAVGDGVRAKIFSERAATASSFDFIPSVPGAVVYDYGGRVAPFNEALIYPTREMGEALFSNLSDHIFYAGRFGAGTTTTFGKIGVPNWGGQGMAMGRIGEYRVMAAVVLNAAGDVFGKDGQRIREHLRPVGSRLNPDSGPKKNTTLSLVITDAPLTRSQLRRLSVMVHSSMAAWIRPFHTSVDGDILFASSLTDEPAEPHEGLEMAIGELASSLMGDAIMSSVSAANDLREQGVVR